MDKYYGRSYSSLVLHFVEDNKMDAVGVLEELLADNRMIEVAVMKTKYPQGDERQLIYALTGREVPAGKLPVDVGCVVFNAETCAAIICLGTELMAAAPTGWSKPGFVTRPTPSPPSITILSPPPSPTLPPPCLLTRAKTFIPFVTSGSSPASLTTAQLT